LNETSEKHQAEVSNLRQAFYTWHAKLQGLPVNFVMIQTEGILTFDLYKNACVVDKLNELEP